jgi:VCBS repeat-containing protein
MSKNIFAPSTGLQLSNLSQSRIAEESITLELNGHGARLDVAAVVQDTPFETLVSVADAQPTASEADRILPSAAAFHDASVDSLHHGLVPLALLGAEGKNGNLAAGLNHSLTPHQNALVATPIITVPPPGSSATTVFEAGLGSRNGEPPGTHAGQPAFPTTTKSGAISFSSDGVQSVSLGGHLLSNVPQTFADGTTGTLTASYTFNVATGKGTITYTYSLLDNTLGVPIASFAVVVTDRDGETNPPVNLVIKIMDDAPVARADTDTLTPGLSTADGNVLTGAGTTPGIADLQGADGGMTIVGVAKGNGPGGDAPSTVGVPIDGAHGKLTLNADGTYTYVFTGGGGNDVFTYTIRDADGSFAHATLTINLGDAAPSNIVIPPANTPGQTQVFEAGLGPRGVEPAGSHAGDSSFPATTSGTITFISPDGVSKIELGSLVLTLSGTPQSFSDATGTLTASYSFNAATGQGTITYSYTLRDNTLSDPSSASFAVAVTDADGDRTAGGNLIINIVDDAPTAIADADSVAAGQTTAETGNVLTGSGTISGTGDVQGADGAAVAGVAVGNTGVDLVNQGTLGVPIAGAFGKLTLNADGSYSYAHNGAPGGGTDTFTYTIRDADGDLSHATLTIAVADSTPGGITIPAPGGADTTVFEAGLPARGSEPAGSDPTKPITTQTGSITFTSPCQLFPVRVDLAENAGTLVLQDQHRRQDESGNLTERPLDRLDLEPRAASGPVEQRYREAIVFDRKAKQHRLAGQRAIMKCGEKKQSVAKRVRLGTAWGLFFPLCVGADSCRMIIHFVLQGYWRHRRAALLRRTHVALALRGIWPKACPAWPRWRHLMDLQMSSPAIVGRTGSPADDRRLRRHAGHRSYPRVRAPAGEAGR